MFLRSLLIASFVILSRCEVEPDKAAEISREIREQFRKSGMNWVSPKMIKEASRWFLDTQGRRWLDPPLHVHTGVGCQLQRQHQAHHVFLYLEIVSGRREQSPRMGGAMANLNTRLPLLTLSDGESPRLCAGAPTAGP